jgi:hypothetical protein
MKEKVKIITHTVDRGTDHDTAMWFVSVDAELSSRWADGAYWQGWIEAEVSRALGFDWMEEQRAGHQFKLCRMTETLFAATLTRQIEGS